MKNSNNTILFSAIFLFSALTLAIIMGCSKDRAVKAETTPIAANQANFTPPAPSAQAAPGTVVETMNAAGYTYVKVQTKGGEIWAASGQFKTKVGDKVIVPLEMPMENFRSSTLKRTFPVIYFTSKVFLQGEAGAPVVTP